MDEELVHALKHGSPGEVVAALAEVHLRYGQRLLGIARRVVGDQAEDVYHSVLVDLPRRVQSFKLQEGGSFSGWLARCVHRAAIDAWREERRLRQREVPQAEFSEELMGGAATGADSQVGCDPAEVVAEQLVQDALKVEVWEVLGQLSDDDRDILCAVDMGEFLSWVEEQGVPTPEVDYEVVDDRTGEYVGTVEVAWPDGVQAGYSEPVAFMLERDSETMSALNRLGFRVFVSPERLKSYLAERIGLAQPEQTVAGFPWLRKPCPGYWSWVVDGPLAVIRGD